MMKYTDLLILSGGVGVTLGVVLLAGYADSPSPYRPGAGDVSEDQVPLYAGRTNMDALPETGEKSESTPPVSRTQAAWLDDEDSIPIRPNRPVPKPFVPGVIQLGPGASLGGRLPFSPENAWNQPIDQEPVDPLSDVLIAGIGEGKNLHPDFGSGYWNGAEIGIPYIVVSKDQPGVPIRFTAYGDQSDPGPYPIPPQAAVEGAPGTDGDRHVLVIDRDNWKLYELYRAFSIADGQIWRADSGAVFDLSRHPQRPLGWTSADAAGLPIFPGLVRYDEAAEQKEIRHALRFTVAKSRRAYVPPASHWASNSSDPLRPPMGMRVRLKQNVDISGFPPEVQVILKALKKYGMILADNGSDWYLSGAPDPRWNDDNLSSLKKIKGSDFEVVLMRDLVEE